ncbi:Retrograde regulation protein 2 [Sphaceloma murrayae]|uniref:Retrograde regulation protein 2 n=1 Tax=Sphaceloma murrayae TaxID=2082308 RepID=A0A2K1QGS9_9PEZI|nr:Retrograde regulation protein 2 [Sphaceloma murrayae]
MANVPNPEHIRAIVDMGSNGIRLSLTSLSPPLTRLLPTLHQSRIPISLYDAQFPAPLPTSTSSCSSPSVRCPIPTSTIALLTRHLLRFKALCASFSVADRNVSLLATEATRTAPNAAELISAIKRETGWDVTLLPKEEEGRVGAYGVASSLGVVDGVVMDLGGGSTQLSVVGRSKNGRIDIAGSASLPYGAAALARRMGTEKADGLETEVKGRLMEAVRGLGLRGGETTLYLSGGGFRGWGYLLMNRHPVQPYPVPIINGFRAGREAFLDTMAVQELVAQTTEAREGHDKKKPPGLFRISERRASQVPAVAFLIKALAECLPRITQVRFCQGGVREGYLFGSLAPEVQVQNPLEVATSPFARGDNHQLGAILRTSLPKEARGRFIPDHIVQAFANTLYAHSNQVKDSRVSSALRFTTSGELASTHGLSHEERAMLSLLLCERWGGRKDLPGTDEDFYHRLSRLLDDGTRWWCKYLGKAGGLCGAVWPAGYAASTDWDLQLTSSFSSGHGKRAEMVVSVKVRGGDNAVQECKTMYEDELDDIEKVGKKKHWIGGRDGFGHKVDVQITLLE